MRVTMVIPTYWARERSVGWREGDAIYDHPTPLDSEGTLLRALKSIRVLNERDFQLVVIAVATAPEIEEKVEQKVARIVKSAELDVETMLFSASHLKKVHELMASEDKNECIDLLRLRGYSCVRNICVFVPHILGADVAILIDDDEVFEDADFIAKATEFIGKKYDGEEVLAVAGYYLNENGDYHIKKPLRPWMKAWNQYECMNAAFDKIIGTEPRLKHTPFVFGGNMVLHRRIWEKVPFDPNVPRGEDIDFLINAKMLRFNFFLDNQLSIKHLPPPKAHPIWMQLRQDIRRFIYERAKIEHQKEVEGMQRVSVEDFDPYPGCFLRADLEERFERACKLLAEEYKAEGDEKGCKEALKNIEIARNEALRWKKLDAFQLFCDIQNRWESLMKWLNKREIRSTMQEILSER
ncbi:MAG: hypothetical protein N2V73_07600 [Candidatus Methanospirare jalkutatii]|nr:hypothetical protein [Candidatus Methanospirare jalkutatii]